MPLTRISSLRVYHRVYYYRSDDERCSEEGAGAEDLAAQRIYQSHKEAGDSGQDVAQHSLGTHLIQEEEYHSDYGHKYGDDLVSLEPALQDEHRDKHHEYGRGVLEHDGVGRRGQLVGCDEGQDVYEGGEWRFQWISL